MSAEKISAYTQHDNFPTFPRSQHAAASPHNGDEVINEDEVAAVLAQSVVHSLVKSGDKPKGDLATQAALDAGADAVMLRLDTVLERAMDEPAEMGGPSPRQTIQLSLGKLERIDAGLKRIASGQGDPKERELILSWISMLQRFDSEAETAAIQAYKQGARVDD